MKTSSLVLLVTGIVLAVSLLCLIFYPTVQDFMAGNTMWNGIHKFAEEKQSTDVESLSDLPQNASGSVLVVIPYLEYDADALTRLKQFVSEGNRLVLMDDFGYGNQVLEALGLPVRFNHNLLLDPLFCYKNGALPRVVNFAPAVKAAGVQAVALNHATCLDNVENSRVIAWSSETSFLDVNQNGTQDASEASGPFPVAAVYPLGAGSVQIVSDPSLIINTMVEQNDNRAFIDYLMGSGNVYLDYAHLSKSPLDTSRLKLDNLRMILANPYVTLGLVAVIFALAAGYLLRKGEIFG